MCWFIFSLLFNVEFYLLTHSCTTSIYTSCKHCTWISLCALGTSLFCTNHFKAYTNNQWTAILLVSKVNYFLFCDYTTCIDDIIFAIKPIPMAFIFINVLFTRNNVEYWCSALFMKPVLSAYFLCIPDP